MPPLLKRLLDVQIKQNTRLKNSTNLFELILKLIMTEYQGFDFESFLDYFFRNKSLYDQVDDMDAILKIAINEKTQEKIKMYFLLILGNIGLYSFLCSNFYPFNIQEKRNNIIEIKINDYIEDKDSRQIRNAQVIIFEMTSKLKKFHFYFNTFDMKYNLFFREFVQQFKEQNFSQMFLNSKGQFYLQNFGKNLENFSKKNEKIKQKLEIRIHNNLKRLNQRFLENVQMYKNPFYFALIFRDFLCKYLYPRHVFIEVKYMSLYEEKSKATDFAIAKKFQFKKIKEETPRLLELLTFLEKNNEPGGLSFFSQLALRIIDKSKKARKRVNLLIMMFGAILHFKKYQEIIGVLDCFCPGSKFLVNLVRFIKEREYSVEDLFVKIGIEHLVISFFLLHFEPIAQELTSFQFIYFLERMQILLKNYHKNSYKYNYLLKDKKSLLEWKTESDLKSELDRDSCFNNISKNFKLWIYVMKSASKLSIFFMHSL